MIATLSHYYLISLGLRTLFPIFPVKIGEGYLKILFLEKNAKLLALYRREIGVFNFLRRKNIF